MYCFHLARGNFYSYITYFTDLSKIFKVESFFTLIMMIVAY